MTTAKPVYYEVSIDVEAATFAEYLAWLDEHVKKILAIPGFCGADIAKKLSTQAGKENVMVTYTVDTMENLNRYLEGHAIVLREEAIKQFGDKIKITRRIFQ